jgi:predicted transposase YbfD/YdcC
MNGTAAAAIQEHFGELTDPRRGEPTYPLMDMVVMTLCAVICGADDFVAIAKFARTKKEWFGQFLDLSNGVPSHDRFNAVIGMLKPAEFEKCLLSWVTSLHEITGGQVIAIDGKTLRGSYDKASSKSAIHMVNAWASENHISLGQVVTDAKSNEITAIPKLLEIIDISGALVTIDAMGCQTDIAEKIVDEGGDYCLAVKGNQPTLQAGIQDFFSPLFDNDFAGAKVRRHVEHETTHGRDVQRFSFICPVPNDLPDKDRWKNLKAIGAVVSISQRNGNEQIEIRYYLLSRYLAGPRFAQAARGHWSVENNLHWQLDVTFGEDQCRLRKNHADANFSILRRTALSLLKNEPTAKVGIKNKRLLCGWDEEYLAKVLFNQ